MPTGPNPPEQAHATVAFQVDPNNLAGALQALHFSMANIQRDVSDVKREQTVIAEQVKKIDINFNGNGSADDPGFAGIIRSIKAWRDNAEPLLASISAWKEAQSAIWRQALVWSNVPIALALATLWSVVTTGHVPPPPGGK